MRKTKMIKVHFPNWQFWIFSLTVNLLVLAVQSKSIIAQVDPNSSQIQAASNTEAANLEPKILSEINRVRTNPQAYAQWLEQQRQYYDGIWLKLPGEKPVRTNRGRKALEEAIATLKEQPPLPPLKTSERTAAAATSELNNFATAKNIQYFSYGRKTASGIVMDLVVDELFPDRRRRQSLLSPEAEDSGIVCKPDPRYAKVCAIAYSDSPALDFFSDTNVAIAQPPAQPSGSETTAAPQPGESAQAEEASPPLAEEKEQPEVVDVPTEETVEEKKEVAATLPAPPQAPPTPPAASNPQPQANEEVSQAEIESEIEEIALENQQEEEEEETEPESEIKDESESESESDEFEESAEEFEEEKQEQEVELDGEEAESSLSEPEEVAINAKNIDFSEEGTLEEGDRVIAEDGSLYDFYPIEGKAGDSFTINLKSDDFDAFVALVDSNGRTIGENDDISQEDSNSQVEITLPEDGVYNVIVNTYDEDGTGKYTLTVTP